MDKAHAVGLVLQQVYVKKIIELYGLEPSFLNTTAETFCDIFKACQFLTTLPPTIITTKIPTTISTTTPTSAPPTITSTTTSTSTSTKIINSTQSANEVSEELEIEDETIKPNNTVSETGSQSF